MYAGARRRAIAQPSKEEVREWLADRVAQHEAPQSPEAIKDRLHWHSAEAERKQVLL